MLNLKRVVIGLCLGLALYGPHQALAEPTVISIQGKLSLGNGDALTGSRAYRVRFYNNATAGSQLGASQVGTVVIPESGRFSLVITPPTQILNQNTVYYELAIDSAPTPDATIDSADVFPTRVQVTSVPFARNAGQLGGAPAGDFAKLGGNTISDPSTQFLGATNDSAVEIHANGQRMLRLTPGPDSANIVAGSELNVIDDGVIAATIAGGGYVGQENRVTDHAGFIGGGSANTAGNDDADFTNATSASVAGGIGNNASAGASSVGGGQNNEASGTHSTVAGGVSNGAIEYGSFVGGGQNNESSGSIATIAGGAENRASGYASFVGGGVNNQSSGYQGVVPGGESNVAGGVGAFAAGYRAKAMHDGSFVWGDSTNTDTTTTAVNQFLIRAGGGVGINTTTPPPGGLGVNGNLSFSGDLQGKAVRTVPAAGARVVHGIIEGSTGATFSGHGFTSSRTSDGRYDIIFSEAFGNLATVQYTAYGNGVPVFPMVIYNDAAISAVQFYNVFGVPTDPSYFYVTAIGP